MDSALAANCSLYLAWHDLPGHVAPYGVCETGPRSAIVSGRDALDCECIELDVPWIVNV